MWWGFEARLRTPQLIAMTARICLKANRSSCDRDTHEKCNDRHQDNKFAMTIFARKVDTGEVVWAYQMTLLRPMGL